MNQLSDRSDDGQLTVTDRTRLRRGREKVRTTRADLDEVLAAGFVCHLGVLVDGAPMVVPTVYGVGDDVLYLHGSVASRSLVQAPDTPVCVTVTQVDGIVLARSVFEHSINYRSVMIYGVPRVVTDPDEKLAGLRAVTEQCAPGQWDYARGPSRKESAATTLLALGLSEVSVKARTGPPDDGEGPDSMTNRWAGVIPLGTVRGNPEPDPLLSADIEMPPHISAMTRAGECADVLGALPVAESEG
ncbi:pyridoxamine 5'-phosphate oxidase family protein [Streptomyces sp. NPDC048644]|uniref:pyridoxamine 5'-phosphate oxidase family protein n=1 Tax=Streptomyces sp. NPDC048644 TaxID=3365582 RepID=UPI00371AE140